VTGTRTVQTTNCPSWCDPSEHIVDRNGDGTVMVIHRSAKRTVVGLCDPQLQQAFNDADPDPIVINVEPSGWAELETPAEARAYVAHFNQVMAELVAKAWPQG